MTENNPRKPMLRRESDFDAKAMADAVMRRDRRRIWSLAIGCVAAWMLVVMLAWGTILPVMARIGQHMLEVNNASTLTPAEQKQHLLSTLQAIKGGTVATFLGSLVTMLIASICTVRLIVTSRSITLRQVNARLDEISDQIKLLASSRP